MAGSLTLALYLATAARSDAQPAQDIGATWPKRPDGRLIWFHTGEQADVSAVHELVARLASRRRGLSFLMTSSAATATAATGPVAVQPVPTENLAAVRRLLDHWRPDLAVWTECDLRPALIAETHARDIPMLLIDARGARPDPDEWRWRRGMAGSLLGRFGHILAGDPGTAAALRKMGADPARLETIGFLEEGTAALPCFEADRDALATLLGGRPVWLAAGCDGDELNAVLVAHSRASQRAHRLLLIVAPDDGMSGTDLAARLTARGWSVATRLSGAEPERDTQIYIADSEGEMGLWYRLAPIAFLGRSLTQGSGRNPFEAAALGSAILHGPHVAGFRAAYDRLGAAGAARLVHDADEIGEAVEHLLSPEVAARMAQAAWRICSSGAEVTDRVIALIAEALDAAEAR